MHKIGIPHIKLSFKVLKLSWEPRTLDDPMELSKVVLPGCRKISLMVQKPGPWGYWRWKTTALMFPLHVQNRLVRNFRISRSGRATQNHFKTLDFFQALHEFDFWRTLVSLFFSFLVCAAAVCNKLNFSSSLSPKDACWNLAVWAEMGREKGEGCVIRSVSVHRNVPAKFKYFWTKE